MVFAYHVTLKENVESIKLNGLIPKSPIDMDDDCAIYMFKTWEDLENAIENWFGDRYDDDADLVVFQVNITKYIKYISSNVGYEYQCSVPIKPKHIKLTNFEI